MYRNLHITIQEAPTHSRRRAEDRGTGRWSDDPTGGARTPDPDDPTGGARTPDPDDPTGGARTPDPDDPTGGARAPDPDDPRGWPYPYAAAPGVYAPLAVHACACPPAACGCGCAPASDAAAAQVPEIPGITSRDWSGFVIVRMAAGLVHGPDQADPSKEVYPETLYRLAEILGLEALKAALEVEVPEPGGGQGGAGQQAVPASAARGGLWPKWPERPAPDRPGKAGKGGKGSGEGGEGGETGDGIPSEGGTAVHSDPEGVLKSAPLIDIVRCERAATVAAIQSLEQGAASTPFPTRHSLNAYWRVDLRPYPERMKEVVVALNRLAEVDLAYREVRAADPQTASMTAGQMLEEDQGYLGDAPVGISARRAWQQLDPDKPRVQVIDLEQGWHDHQDLAALPGTVRYGDSRTVDDPGAGEHGTAVVAQLVATGGSPFGVVGAAEAISKLQLVSHYQRRKSVAHPHPDHPFPGTNGHVAAAIVNALVGKDALNAGDVLLLEVQRGRWPTEIDEADLDAIRLASAMGVIVVEAAGNGGHDLDLYRDPQTGRGFERRGSGFVDSGAIFVGAAYSALPHDRAPFSNHGSRLDCYAWGEAVTTCGYGDLAGTAPHQFYTNTFSGTSSAAPIIAGAATLVQHLHRSATGHWLMPKAMRAVLSDPATGTPQGPNVAGHIGVMPDLGAIVRHQLQLVPDVYMRRAVGDDGAQPYEGDEVSSSPDILVTEEKASAPGEGPESNRPAPGRAFRPHQPLDIYQQAKVHVRLRNRGGGNGAARVQLFASRAATLITPERWQPLGDAKQIGAIPQGDVLTVGEVLALGSVSLPPVPAPPPKPPVWEAPAEPPYSFLAVQLPVDPVPCHGMEQILPPGPPWFDWHAWRTFLRGPGVAWRNVHGVRVAKLADPGRFDLAFLLAGTPDRGRYFDLEILQRLPAGVEVTLRVPAAVAAKLRQRQLSLGTNSTPEALPQRCRTTFRRVHLPAGACIQAAFRLEVAQPSGPTDLSGLAPGHSLAIRQLWRGEEVGRITWWFV